MNVLIIHHSISDRGSTWPSRQVPEITCPCPGSREATPHEATLSSCTFHKKRKSKIVTKLTIQGESLFGIIHMVVEVFISGRPAGMVFIGQCVTVV